MEPARPNPRSLQTLAEQPVSRSQDHRYPTTVEYRHINALGNNSN